MKARLLELMRQRQSDRGYTGRPVEQEKIDRALEAARLAPSACNAQPWKFIVVDEPGLKNRIACTTTSGLLPLNHFTRQAPVHVVVVMEQANLTSRLGSRIKDKHLPLLDIGIAVEHLCLQAAEDGLGSCIIGWFNEGQVRTLLDIPASSRPVLIVTLGYSSSPVIRPKKRKPIAEIAARNRYHGPWP